MELTIFNINYSYQQEFFYALDNCSLFQQLPWPLLDIKTQQMQTLVLYQFSVNYYFINYLYVTDLFIYLIAKCHIA